MNNFRKEKEKYHKHRREKKKIIRLWQQIWREDEKDQFLKQYI